MFFSKAYGLVKIHKVNFPLRPIISTINSPTYELSKFFANFLQKNIKLPTSHIHTQKKYMNKQFEINKLPKEYSIMINNLEFLSPS